MRGPIVVGTDGSETSRLAIEEAALLSKGAGEPVVLVFVRQPRLAGLGAVGPGAWAWRWSKKHWTAVSVWPRRRASPSSILPASAGASRSGPVIRPRS